MGEAVPIFLWLFVILSSTTVAQVLNNPLLEDLAREVATARRLPPPELRRAIREAAGVSLARVGAACGVTKQAVHTWEHGRRTPRGEHLSAYLRVLDVLKGAGS